MSELRQLIDLLLRIFALGLFITVILNLVVTNPPNKFHKQLNAFYDRFLNPLRRSIKPVKLSASAPSGIDFTPLILLVLVWWAVHPFLMWVLGG